MNTKTRQKNSGKKGALALAFTGLTLALLLTTHTLSARGVNSSGILHPGAGEQYVDGYIILDANTTNPSSNPTYFDARSSARPSFFQASKNVAYSVLTSLYDFTVVDGPLFIGFPLGAFQSSIGSGIDFGLNTNPSQNGNNPIIKLWTYNYGNGINPFSATLQKVNVAGAVRSSALSHQFTDPQRVCVNDEGIFTLECPGLPQSYQCSGTVPSNATLCSGDSQGLNRDTPIILVSSCTNDQKCEYICDTGYHIENGVCVEDISYHWQAGDWGQCSQATQAHCEGSWVTNVCHIFYECNGITSSDNEWYNLPQQVRNNGCSDNQYHNFDISTDSYSDCTASIRNYCYYFANSGGNITDSSGNPLSSNANDCFVSGTTSPGGSSYQVHYGESSYDDGVTNYCSASNPQSQSVCESQNSACHWVDAQDSVRTRNVWCENQNGNVVPDANCDANTRPDDVELCPNPTCFTGLWAENDSSHPNGGSVTYTDVDGNQQTMDHIWSGHKYHIYGSISSMNGAIQSTCGPDCNLYVEDACGVGEQCCGDGRCIPDNLNCQV